MALPEAGASSSPRRDRACEMVDSATDATNTSEFPSAGGSPSMDSTFVKSISQNYNVDELRRLLREIYCSTVHSLNLEVIQVWLQVVQDIGEFLRSQDEQAYLQSYSRAMHLRLTTCWNEILYAIIGHVRHAPNLLGQTFQKSAANKKVAVNGCIACFCRFCSQVGLTWNKGVSDILSLLRTILTILQEHQQDTAQVDAWIRQAEESQANISTACSEFQKTFKVLSSLVDDGGGCKEVPSEAGLMQKLLSVCTGGDTRLENEMVMHMQDDVLMAERLIASNAVYQAKTVVLKAWNETVSHLLASFVRTWLHDIPTASTDCYVAALESYHGSWARILSSAMVGTDMIESEFIRGELQSAAIKSVQESLLSDLHRETELVRAPRLETADAGLGHLGSLMCDNWKVLSRAEEQAVASIGQLLNSQPPHEAGPVDQSVLSRLYVEASSCLERYEQVGSLMRHFALYEANTTSYSNQLARACEKLHLALASRLDSPQGHDTVPPLQLLQLRKLNGIRDDLTVLQGDLLVWLKDKRKERQIPDSFPLLFQSTLTGWLLDFEKVVKDIREEVQATGELAQKRPDKRKFQGSINGLLELLEDGSRRVTAITHKAFSPGTWQINDISILANMSRSVTEI